MNLIDFIVFICVVTLILGGLSLVSAQETARKRWIGAIIYALAMSLIFVLIMVAYNPRFE